MNRQIDNDLKDLHDQFKTDHAEECDRLMQAVSDQIPTAPAHVQVTRVLAKRGHALAAAAAIAIGVWLVFFATGRSSVAWAAVLDQLSHISSIAWKQATIISKDGFAENDASATRWNQCYLREPSLYRVEQWNGTSPNLPVKDSRADLIQIYRAERGGFMQIHLYPQEKKAVRWFNKRPQSLDTVPNVPNEIWDKLQDIEEESVSNLGSMRIGNVKAVGFEVPSNFFDPDADDLMESIRIWVHPDSAVPMRIEGRYRSEDSCVTTILEDIVWNVAIDDEAFAVPDDPDWQIEDSTTYHPKNATPSKLRPGVTLSISTESGEQILTEKHVVSVSVSYTESDSDHSTSLSCTVTPEGSAILAEYSASHIGQKITISLNGQVVGQPTIQAKVSTGFRIDLPSDQINLEELLEPNPESDSSPDTGKTQ